MSTSPKRNRWKMSAAALMSLALLTACVPGATGGGDTANTPRPEVSGVPEPSTAGKVTLRVWDQEVRGGQNASVEQLNKEFEKKYPNVTIDRTSRSFSDLRTTLKLALSGENPPDVVQANQGYGSMVEFVGAGLLAPVDGYAKAFGWTDEFPQTLLNLNRVDKEKMSFGSGKLYGLSQTGEYIGIYYNKKVLKEAGVEVPTSWEDFQESLPRLKKAGTLPVQFGNLDKYPAIHTFGVLQDHEGDSEEIRQTVFGEGPGFDTAQTKNAASTLAMWNEKGFIPESANGLAYDAATKKFASGQGAYLVTGTWLLADLKPKMKDNVGFMVPPPAEGASGPVTTGGEGLAWSITSKSDHADVAAAYIDFITNAHASDVLVENGMLPIVPAKAAAAVEASSADGRMLAGWEALNKNDGLVPYLDYTTPTFYDTLSAQLQGLIDGRTTPDDFAKTVQKNYSEFHEKNK